MTSLSEQLKLEHNVVQNDALKYYTKQDKLRDKQLGDQVDSHAYIIRTAVLDVANTLEDFATRKTKGVGGKYNALLRKAAQRIDPKEGITYDYPAVAFLGLQAIFQAMSGRKQKGTWNKLAHTIAARLEADHKARLFRAHEPAYFDAVLKSFSTQMVQQYQHKQRVLMMKFNEFEIQWTPWEGHEKLQIANKVLIATLHTLPDIFFRSMSKKYGKTQVYVDTTAAADEWFAEFERESGFMRPSHPPLIIEPIPWTRDADGLVSGGYYTHGLAKNLPFVKAYSDDHKAYLTQHEMKAHVKAINRMQSTAWKINQEVLDVQTEMFKLQLGCGLPKYSPQELPDFPQHIAQIHQALWTDEQLSEVQLWKGVCKRIHTQNRINKGKVLAYKSIADTAKEYSKHEAFHFVYNADFRGRIYCATSGLSPQGEDLAKGLLTFGSKVVTGETGLFWLAVHGAGKYGFDKVSLEARVDWTYSQEVQFKDVVRDPISTRKYWGSADKPWQFLAFIFEWAKTDYGKNPNAKSSLPVALDGSCNGIQHYSAILRDRVGGRSVNLMDSLLPCDIYQDVAEVLIQKLMASNQRNATTWLAANITRKLTKRPVMTLPYGSTRQSCKEYIYEWMLENRSAFPPDDRELYVLATYLTNLLWDSIGEVVIAARAAMIWLQKSTSDVLRVDPAAPIKWLSPALFPVYQGYMIPEIFRVNTMIAGSIVARVQTQSSVATKDVHKHKQRTGIAPNFIHSIDSSHMVMTINSIDLPGYAMIHDDFGTHAGNTEALWHQIRTSFVDLYENSMPLEDWADQQPHDIVRPFPELGDLDIRDVLDSTFFFA